MKNKLLMFLLVFVCFVGCKTIEKTVEIPIEIKDTVRVTDIKYDSIYIEKNRDVFIKGDTVYLRDKYIEYKEKQIHDTLTVVKEIEKPIYITETEEIVKHPWYEKYLIWSFVFSILYLLFKFRKNIFTFFNKI